MAYSQPFIRVSFGGSTAGGLDIWSCQFHLATVDPLANQLEWWNAVTSQAENIKDLVEDFVGNPAALIPQGVNLDWVKLAMVGEDGRYMYEAVEVQADKSGGVMGSFIPQATIAFTMESPKWKDPGKYNRFYLPTSNPSGNGEFRLNQSQVNLALTTCQTLIEGVNEILAGLTATPASMVSVVSGTREGSTLAVIKLRLGRVIDTQRRRRNAIPEEYTSRTINLV